MSNIENKDFFNLINTLVTEQTFDSKLSNGKSYTFKQLNTFQLKELVKAVVDSPLTQSLFNTTISKIFKDSIVLTEPENYTFNVFDRLIFILETRINSISPTIKQEANEKTYVVDLKDIVEKLKTSVQNSKANLEDKTFVEESISVTYGVPSIDSDERMNKEVYKDIKPDVENTDELRKLLGEAFINEITKSVKKIKLGEKEFNFDTIDFKTRVKMVESLPASIIKKVINFVEEYKQLIEEVLQVNKEFSLPIDGSLFSLR